MNFYDIFDIYEKNRSKIKDKNDKKGRFLSRLFGIFSEEIVRIWAKNECSPYTDIGRPTLYTDDGKHYTLDFTFEKDGKYFIVEMKSEIQYQNYKFLTLDNNLEKIQQIKYLDHHMKKKSFDLFLNFQKAKEIKVKTKIITPEGLPKEEQKVIEPSGSILIWGRKSNGFSVDEFNENYSNIHGKQIKFSNILSLEDMINDLIEWKDEEYIEFIETYKNWTDRFFHDLLPKENNG